MIIADDGDDTVEKFDVYASLIGEGHQVIILPWDSGFGMKSNRIADQLQTPFLLVGSDDFDFSPASVREGIERLTEALDSTPRLSIVSGRVSNRPYEFALADEGHRVQEFPIEYSDGMPYCPCDLTVNYSLIRKEVFHKVCWDDDVKIGGGEHGAFFVDCKRAGFEVAYVPGVSISEQRIPSSARYRQFRARANGLERPCFDKRGITEYILGDGRTDYKK